MIEFSLHQLFSRNEWLLCVGTVRTVSNTFVFQLLDTGSGCRRIEVQLYLYSCTVINVDELIMNNEDKHDSTINSTEFANVGTFSGFFLYLTLG